MRDGKKGFTFYRVALLLLSFCLILTGCRSASGDQPGQDQADADQPLRVVSGGGEGEPAPPVSIWLLVPKSSVEYGEDIEITVWFRGFESPEASPSEPCKIECEVSMRSQVMEEAGGDREVDKEIVIKKYENFSTDYYLNYEQDGRKYVGAEETIILPADWFTRQEGVIVVDIDQKVKHENEAYSDWTGGSGACLYYVKNQKNIQLYGSYYDYYNRKE